MSVKRPPISYRLLSLLLFFFWLIHAFWHAVKSRQAKYFYQRLGLVSSPSDHSIWLHASSVGEVTLLKPLVEQLEKNHSILLTTFTASGLQHAQRIMPQQTRLAALPIDFYPISRTFIKRHHFKLALIAETELWPETLFQCKTARIPLLHVNARLSRKSLIARSWIQHILQLTLGYFDQHLTRTERDRKNFLSMQVIPEKIAIVGNLKYAGVNEDENYPDLIGRPYILFASTHAPEEKLFAQLAQSLNYPELSVIAPRHPVRAPEILKALNSLGMVVKQRSRNQAITEDTQIYLADTLGELKALIAHAKLVVMGGSFTQVGGHNVIEPASLGKAVITGPSDDNIQADIALLTEHLAIIQVQDIDQLKQKLQELLDHPKRLEQLAGNAKTTMDQQGHVLDRYLETINHYL